MRTFNAERILSGVAIGMLVYNRLASLTPGTDLALSLTKRLSAPANVRLEEISRTDDGFQMFMLFVDHSYQWMLVAAFAGVAWIVYWSLRSRYQKGAPSGNFSQEELNQPDANQKHQNE